MPEMVNRKIRLSIELIKIDGGTQPREVIDDNLVAEYADAMTDGAKFPPVIVFHDGGAYWLADGFHRYWAATKNEWKTIDAEVRKGTRRDAVLFSCGANTDHGLRRTNADKRRAVETLLTDPEWAKWSDREIATQCRVGRDLVGELRKLHLSETTDTTRKTKRNGTEYERVGRSTRRPRRNSAMPLFRPSRRECFGGSSRRRRICLGFQVQAFNRPSLEGQPNRHEPQNWWEGDAKREYGPAPC